MLLRSTRRSGGGRATPARRRASRRSPSASCTPTPIRRTSRRRGARAARELPGASPSSLSPRSRREWREYERTSTAVLNAYVQPIVERYLAHSSGGSPRRGFDAPASAMQSNGGVASFAAARARPISLVESGPVGGRRSARPARRGDRRAERDHARHRRHDGEVLADRGRRASRSTTDYRIECDADMPATRSSSRSSTSSRSAPAAARSPGSTTGGVAQRRTAKRGRRARARLLRPRRHRADRDRRQPRRRPDRSRLLPRRRLASAPTLARTGARAALGERARPDRRRGWRTGSSGS